MSHDFFLATYCMLVTWLRHHLRCRLLLGVVVPLERLPGEGIGPTKLPEAEENEGNGSLLSLEMSYPGMLVLQRQRQIKVLPCGKAEWGGKGLKWISIFTGNPCKLDTHNIHCTVSKLNNYFTKVTNNTLIESVGHVKVFHRYHLKWNKIGDIAKDTLQHQWWQKVWQFCQLPGKMIW